MSTNILVECPELIASVRVGVIEPLSCLGNSGSCIVKFVRTIEIRKKDIEWCDILITVRGYEHVTLEIVKAAKAAGRFIIYFLDDDLLHIPEYLPSGKYLQNKEIRSNLIEIIEKSNLLWCVNPVIGEKYSIYCRDKWILSRVPVKNDIDYIVENKDVIRILYAGSSDHSGAIIKYISPVVSKLCDEYGDKLEFTFIGVNPKLQKHKNVKYIEYINDYNEYKSLVKSVNFDIGIAILQDDDFYKAKYYNKFIEYTSIGAVGVYTNSAPYSIIINNNENGFLCDNNSWYDTLKKAINENDLRSKCYNNAHNLIKEKFNHEIISAELAELIPEIVSFQANKKNKVILNNPKREFIKHRLIEIWKKHKILFVFLVFMKGIRFTVRSIKAKIGKIRRKL